MEVPTPPLASTGRWLGVIHIKVAIDLEVKKGQGWMKVFTVDAVMIRSPIRA